jgi:hypothetical protein
MQRHVVDVAFDVTAAKSASVLPDWRYFFGLLHFGGHSHLLCHLMLKEHPCYRTHFLSSASRRSRGRKERLLLLTVVANVDKILGKIDHLIQDWRRDLSLPLINSSAVAPSAVSIFSIS